MMIPRLLFKTLNESLFKGKILLILGARQVGKTTLINHLASQINYPVLELNCDEADVRSLLSNINIEVWKSVIGSAKIVFIDEAQRVQNIGLALKIAVDQIKDVQFIVSGSSAFELANSVNEPLTGRKIEFQLFPISLGEFQNQNGRLETGRRLHSMLVYGMYPDVLMNKGEEKEILKNLSNSYLYKDIFSFQEIRKPELFEKLLKALAFQMGSEVSYTEIGQLVGSDTETVQRYIDLLEKSFVIFRLGSFSRNLRNELKKSRKIFFYDNGIRNAILNDFRSLEIREDKGALFENFVISERIKSNHYAKNYVNYYFWRTLQQQEIDLIEEADGRLKAFEIKSNPKTKVNFSKTFLHGYPNHETAVINPNNIFDYI